MKNENETETTKNRNENETKLRSSDFFDIEAKRKNLFQNFAGTKWDEPNCSKTFQMEVEQTKLFHIFSRGFDGCTGPG